LETTNQTFSVGDNYETTLQGATLACFATQDHDDDTSGVYAALVVAPFIPQSQNPLDKGVNRTMFMEADVAELPSSGALFVPKQRCFDMTKHDVRRFPNLIYRKETNEREVLLGPSAGTLRSDAHLMQSIILDYDRSSPNNTSPTSLGLNIAILADFAEWLSFLILSAYHTPKAALWAFLKSSAFRVGGSGKWLFDASKRVPGLDLDSPC